jgi:hypothetical protein
MQCYGINHYQRIFMYISYEPNHRSTAGKGLQPSYATYARYQVGF